jgi:hypothetical protein
MHDLHNMNREQWIASLVETAKRVGANVTETPHGLKVIAMYPGELAKFVEACMPVPVESLGRDADVSAVPAWEMDQDVIESPCGIWTASISIGAHMAAIECHADTRDAAIALARHVMRVSVDGIPVEISPEFTDTARGAIAWVLYHHQGGSSPIGQPLRYALGLGAHERMTEDLILQATRYAATMGGKTADFHTARAAAAKPAPMSRNEAFSLAARYDQPAGEPVPLPRPVARVHAESYTHLLWLYPAPYQYPPDGSYMFTEDQLREYAERVAAPLRERVAELERKTLCMMDVGGGSGQLFVYGDYYAIKAAQAIVIRAEAAERERDEARRGVPNA